MIGKALTLILLLLLPAGATIAQDSARIVYLGLEDDPYYQPQPTYTGLSLRDRERPTTGARVAMRGFKVVGRALGLSVELEEIMLTTEDETERVVRSAWKNGALAIILDLPAEALGRALSVTDGTKGIYFNIRHPEERWRAENCAPNLLHTIPTFSMRSDAVAQHLRAQGWERVLLLGGTSDADAVEIEAVHGSAKKFGLKIVEDKSFELSNDPRHRGKNNITLLTGGSRHDVVWVVDNEGEFGRYVPFATYAARPVIGAEGLTPHAWHWTYERHGAPQLNQRFRRAAGRNMTSYDWAAWVAVRAIVEGVSRTASTKTAALSDYIRSEDFRMDLYKGVPGSFRAWDGQLRQPILLATHNAVIALAPVDGFEHKTNTLDTLGTDVVESVCKN